MQKSTAHMQETSFISEISPWLPERQWDSIFSINTHFCIFIFIPAGTGSPGQCTVTDLSTSSQRYLLGYQNVNGKGRIYSAAGALHWSGAGINEVCWFVCMFVCLSVELCLSYTV